MKLSKKELWEIWYGFQALPRKIPKNLAWKVTQNKLALADVVEKLAEERVTFFRETFSALPVKNPETEEEISYSKSVKDYKKNLKDRGEGFVYWNEAWAEYLKLDFQLSISKKEEYDNYKEFLEGVEGEDEYTKFEKDLENEKDDYEHLGLAVLQLEEFPETVDMTAMTLLNPLIYETIMKNKPKKQG